MATINNKNDIVRHAVDKCIKEMYKHAWPKTTFNKAIKEFKESSEEEQNKYPFYVRYYLSENDYNNIVNEYLELYDLEDSLKEHIDLIIDNLQNGLNLPEIEKEKRGISGKTLEETVGKENAEKCIKLIEEYKRFYKTNFYENTFRFNVMNYSPSSNKEEVERYWKYKKSLNNK